LSIQATTPQGDQQLKRSVGVLSLFATAYGNVGSSIYYALGLVASHALGLTPLVFLFAGGLFRSAPGSR
jgi:APA family basic amino acid/polyamine antiporter